jgi:hypothetical protein
MSTSSFTRVRSPRPIALALALVVGTAGCGGGEPAVAPDRSASASAASPAADPGGRAPRTLPLPSASPAVPAPAEGAGAALRWDVPSGWATEAPRSPMRRAQYRVPGTAGDGECIVFYFGPGQGGDPASNAVRWAQQFEQPDGRSSVDAMTMGELDGTQVPLYLVEVTGTYDGGMTMTDAPATRQPGSMLLGGIAEGSDAHWFFKLTGPEATVRAAREEFIAMMRSVRPGEP